MKMTSMKISFEQQYCNFQIMYCLQGLKGERGWKGEKVSINLKTFILHVGSLSLVTSAFNIVFKPVQHGNYSVYLSNRFIIIYLSLG